MAVSINLPQLDSPASFHSLVASTYWIHQNGGGVKLKIRFNRRGWQQLPEYIDLVVYDCSIDVEKGGASTMEITDISNLDNRVGQLQQLG